MASHDDAAPDLGQRILDHVDKHGELHTSEFAAAEGADVREVVGKVMSFVANELLVADTLEDRGHEPTDEGRAVAEEGSPEARLVALVRAAGGDGLPRADAEAALGKDALKVGLGQAMRNKWLALDKGTGKFSLGASEAPAKDPAQEALRALLRGEDGGPDVAALVKRKLAKAYVRKAFRAKRGPKFTTDFVKPEQDLTPAMLASGSWREASFRPYNFDAMGVRPKGGDLHPLRKAQSEFRQIFLEMGFSEMPTNQWVESSFWNFDALFQPQQHPARDAHDTFFLTSPAETRSLPSGGYAERVQAMHENGAGSGGESIGYRMKWEASEARKTILRTHTTAVSSRMLHALATQPGGFKPTKRFSIDRVFRNESLDATHLAEFHQIEGWIADYGLTLGDLIGTLEDFLGRLGLSKLKFKPAYNPYTEPSMEIFAYHEGLDRYVEIGNSGMFRPEMLLPMGLPPDVRVVAWGLGLERQVMIRSGLDNIRDLVGHKLSLDFVRSDPICRLDR